MTPEEQLATAQKRIRELEGLYLEAAIDAYLDPKTGAGPENREQLWAEYRPESINPWQVFRRDSRAPSGIAVRGVFTTHYLLPYVRSAITEAVAAERAACAGRVWQAYNDMFDQVGFSSATSALEDVAKAIENRSQT